WDEIFWGYAHGVGAKQSPKFHRFSWSFAQDSPFESNFSGVFWVLQVRPVGTTSQTGPAHRSDQSSAPVRPVQADQFCSFPNSLPICFVVSLASSRPFVLVSLFHSYSKLWPERLRVWVIFRDIGRRFKFRRNFDRLPFTPLWSRLRSFTFFIEVYTCYE